MPLFLIVIVLGLLELFLLIRVGAFIGAFNTVAIVVITALFGIYYARSEGMSMQRRMQEMMNRGQAPTSEALDALLIFGGGAFLIIPGFLTDIFGIICLLPFTRPWLRQAIAGHYRGRMGVYTATSTRQWGEPANREERPQERIIDVEYEERHESSDDDPSNKPDRH
ncbi:FxsA family protein [Desulfurispira natronophila]|uniref:UPF0716 protein FxsA n=1 Tax=Desulfurispira natronophila TaxID=682562 RepID=A0A7W8DG83_9BACT|nr:FxsA family protein [Desulfurispira natronophila]MBB5021152.1 UPF0716 protein FxsA [Desulfurispira natronophila]